MTIDFLSIQLMQSSLLQGAKVEIESVAIVGKVVDSQ